MKEFKVEVRVLEKSIWLIFRKVLEKSLKFVSEKGHKPCYDILSKVSAVSDWVACGKSKDNQSHRMTCSLIKRSISLGKKHFNVKVKLMRLNSFFTWSYISSLVIYITVCTGLKLGNYFCCLFRKLCVSLKLWVLQYE